MKTSVLMLLFLGLTVGLSAETSLPGPANDKAQKTYKQALDFLHEHNYGPALDAFKKADKQDDGRCRDCQDKMIQYGVQLEDWKAAELAGHEMISETQATRDAALAHYALALVFMREATQKHKDEFLNQAHDEMTKALAATANFPDAVFTDGIVLARLKQDDAAKAQFQKYVAMRSADDPNRQRALRYISEPEMARARMAPAFAVTTLDGQRVALDDLKGKVVLIDFWATWCPSCREALPHIRDIAKKFQGQPLVILSVSLDDDEQKWKEFVAKNEMTWPQCREKGFNGPIATSFGIHVIPQTFTIDADGVLQDQHIGDASIEGKLKKLISRVHDAQVAEAPKQ